MSVMFSHVFKDSEEELRRNQEMDSSIGNPQQHCHQHNSGLLLRYHSAPSSLLTCLKEEAFLSADNQQCYFQSTSSEMDTMLSNLISYNNGWSYSELMEEFLSKPVKQETEGDSVSEQSDYSYGGFYQSQKIQGLSNDSSSSVARDDFDGSFFVVNSIPLENTTQSEIIGVQNGSSLIRQKSSPAGFFSGQNGLAALREVGSFTTASNVSNGQTSASSCGLPSTPVQTFSSRPSSCLKRMAPIDENENESLEENCDQSRNLMYGNDSFSCEFWEDSAFNNQKTESEDEIMIPTSNAMGPKDTDACYQNLGLTKHLSLPSPSTKMASMEKLLQIQGSVPFKIRAKRGFATHPRSIAERVRRTKISERIKKLQGLFPQSDKQTSTADMLDLAVEYIKELQERVKILRDNEAKCKCSR